MKIWDKFITYLSENGTSIKSACNAIDITTKSYYNHRVEDSDFAKKVDNVMDNIHVPFAEDALFSLINDRNLGAIKFFLSQRGGRRWNDSRVIPIVVQQELKFQPRPESRVQKMPDESQRLAGQICEELIDIEDEGKYPDKVTFDLTGDRVKIIEKK